MQARRTDLALISIGRYPACRARIWTKVVFPTPGGPFKSRIWMQRSWDKKNTSKNRTAGHLWLRTSTILIISASSRLPIRRAFTKHYRIPRFEPLKDAAIASLKEEGKCPEWFEETRLLHITFIPHHSRGEGKISVNICWPIILHSRCCRKHNKFINDRSGGRK